MSKTSAVVIPSIPTPGSTEESLVDTEGNVVETESSVFIGFTTESDDFETEGKPLHVQQKVQTS